MYLRNWHKAFRAKELLKLPSRMLQALSLIMFRSSFFLQGQMDINQKSLWFNPNLVKEIGGFFPPNTNIDGRSLIDIEPWDNVRRDMFFLLLKQIEMNSINGSIAEVGVYKGSTAKLMHHYFPERNLFLFDTFEGFTSEVVNNEKQNTGEIISAFQFADTSIGFVKEYISPLNDNIEFIKGLFPESANDTHKNCSYAFVSIDVDLYEPVLNSLRFFLPRMQKGGYIVVHDFHAWKGANKAVIDFSIESGIKYIPMPDKSGSAIFSL